MRSFFIILLAPLLFSTVATQAQPTPPVLEPTILRLAYQDQIGLRKAGVRYRGEANYLSGQERVAQRSYFDGLGRTIQQVQFDAGNVANPDILRIYQYDNKGRQQKQYLPYAIDAGIQYRPAAISEQQAFYSASSGKYAKDSYPYAESVFDQSPLNRVLQQGGVGSAWQLGSGNVQRVLLRPNSHMDSVRQFQPSGNSISYWAAGSLQVSRVEDEGGAVYLEYTDKSGRIVLQRRVVNETIEGVHRSGLDTYTIYDAMGFAVMVIPPKVSAILKATGWSWSGSSHSPHVYQYSYDERGRMVASRIPDGDWAYMVYDKLDRLSLLQTSTQRQTNSWFFVKYDGMGRQIVEGSLQDNIRTSRTAMQAYCDSYDYDNATVPCYEYTDGSPLGYTDRTFPQQGSAFTAYEPHAVSFYDDYDYNRDGTADYSYIPQGLGTDEPIQGSAQGYLTRMRHRVMGTADWMEALYFYDREGRIIQQQGNNISQLTIADVHTNVLHYDGSLKRSLSKKKVGTIVHTVDEQLSYDAAARLESVSHSYNSQPTQVLAHYTYNELGQLTDKQLGVLSPSTFLQRVDLRYHIRGWLTHINNATLTPDGYNQDSDDLFGMELMYEQQDAALDNTALYDGKISAIRWRVKQGSHPFDNVERSYIYDYDKRGQLKNAIFKARSSTGWDYRNGTFSEKDIRYDLNGNLLHLERNTMDLGTGALIPMDKLSYAYGSLGNRLTTVHDAYGAAGSYGFKNQSSAAVHYTYDADGRILEDRNRGMTYSYNTLGKVSRISWSSSKYIEYRYSGAGVCLDKTVVDGGSTVSMTAYMGAFVVQNGSLNYVTTTEGRMRISGGTAVYEYFIRDHLGAVRASFEKGSAGTAVLRQENSYYGYGLVHSATITPTDANKELYNGGSLWENDFANDPDLYSTGIRQYDPVLGRFNGTDPMAAKYAMLSPYQYAFNNPVSFSDPTGADPDYSEWWDMFWQDIYYNPAYQYGGYWNDPWKGTNTFMGFNDHWAAFNYYADMLDQQQGWRQTTIGNYDQAYDNMVNKIGDVDIYGNVMLRSVSIREMNSNSNWLSSRIDEVWGDGGAGSNSWALLLGAVGGGTQVVETHFQALEASTRTDGSVNWAGYSAHTLWLDKINNFGGDMGSAGTPTLNRRIVAKGGSSGASLSTNGVKLSQHLGQLEKYGAGGFKELTNERFRYYGQATLNRGDANSFRMVREWNPATGGKRTWFETLNPNGSVIQVRPEFGTGVKTHYLFNGTGGYLGKW